jgi:hypothetical protein
MFPGCKGLSAGLSATVGFEGTASHSFADSGDPANGETKERKSLAT